MVYTEWLRVRGALKWISIVLGVVVVVCVFARVGLLRLEGVGIIDHLQKQPDSKETVTTLPDGVKRTTIVNDREKASVTIDDRGYDGKHIVVVRKHVEGSSFNGGLGSVSVQTTTSGDSDILVVDTNVPTPFGDLTITGLVLALIAATILGAPFAKESDGHLEIALTKPIGRTALSLQTMLVDCAGVIAAFAIGIVFSIVVHALFQSLKIRIGWQDGASVAAALLVSIAWYAMLNALTASIKRAYGVVVGLAWPVAGVVLLLANLPPGNDIRDLLRTIFGAVSYVDPLNYLSLASVTPNQLILLAVLALVYGTLAAIQWRRVEA